MKGIGVPLGFLGGNAETVEVHQRAIGKTIKSAKLSDDVLKFEFTDGTGLNVWDDGQSCCEERYMTTDDDLSAFAGAEFRGLDLRDGPTVVGGYGDVHEVQFLIVKTSLGDFTMETHNEHNGYYSGFWIICQSF